MSTAIGLGLTVGPPGVLLWLAAGALSLCIFWVWSSLQRLEDPGSMDFNEALDFAAPTATEEQKRAVLRALKDLEYEKAVGKISGEDFEKVSAEYREQAKRLIYEQDEQMKERRAQAERRVASALTRAEKKKSSIKKKKKSNKKGAQGKAEASS